MDIVRYFYPLTIHLMKENIQILYDIIKLSMKSYKIVGQETIIVHDWDNVYEDYVFTIESRARSWVCPCCKKRTQKRKDRRDYYTQPLKHIVLSDKRQIMIKWKRRYWRCGGCRKSFMEKHDYESADNTRHTKTFEEYVLCARWQMSGCAIWRHTRTSPSKIHKIYQTIDPDTMKQEWLKRMETVDKIYIGIDEHSFQGRDMVVVITDIYHKKVLDILTVLSQTEVKKRFMELPSHIKPKIQWVSADMNKTYIQTITGLLPHVVSTVDKYHMVQEANRMMDDVRQLNHWLIKMGDIEEQEKENICTAWKLPSCLTRKKKGIKWTQTAKHKPQNTVTNFIWQAQSADGTSREFLEITEQYFIQSKNGYKTLFMRREKNMSQLQKLRIRQLLREFDYKWFLSEAWMFKEMFIDALDDRCYDDIVVIMNWALSSNHYRIQTRWKTLRRWKRELKNFCEHSSEAFAFTNSFTESVNNQSKICKKVGHWFRHKDNYRRKLVARFVYDPVKNPRNFSHKWE